MKLKIFIFLISVLFLIDFKSLIGSTFFLIKNFELINFSLKTEQVLLSIQNDFPFNELSILKKSSFL